MKKIILFITLISFISNAQITLDFETAVSTDTHSGASFEIATNPDDNTDNVGKISKDGTDDWARVVFNLTNYVDFSASGTKTFTFDYYSDDTHASIFKLINAKCGSGDVEVNFTPSGSGWESVTIDMTSKSEDDQYTSIEIYPSKEQKIVQSYYIDDLIYSDGGQTLTLTPATSFVINPTDSCGWGSADTADVSVSNGVAIASNVCGNGTKQDWAQVYYSVPAAGYSSIDLSGADKGFKFKIKGSRESKLMFKLQPGSSWWDNVEVWDLSDGDANRKKADLHYDNVGSWQTFLVDLSDKTNTNWDRIVFFFDPQTEPNADPSLDVFEIDDIELGVFSALSVKENNLIDFTVYPNPATDLVNINSANSIDSYSIYDLTGRVVKNSNPNSNNFRIDVTSLSKGVYLVKLNSGDKTSSVKLIKEN
ncbi:MAG: T9SS type A sorting domain-containing protein [Flavobacteriaceae bacterium]